jgi:hypothetical protein
MRTRTFKLTTSEEQALQVAYLHCQDGATRTRYQAVRLYGIGYAVAEVMHVLDRYSCCPANFGDRSSAFHA